MKTTKLFFIAALALIFAACSNNDDELTQQPAEQPADNMITVTAKLAPKSGTTRAVTESEGNIVVDWAVNEKLKIIGEGGEETTANIDAVDASGVATISFDISNTAKDKDCTIIYPYDAAVTKTAGVYTADPITAQNGTLNAGLDVRIGEGHITDGATPTLDVTMQPQAMFAIWKLTLANEAKGLYITADGVLIAGVTLGTANTEFTIAVPAVDTKTVAVVATNGSDCKSYSKAGVSLTAGKYYQSSPTMTAVSSSSSEAVYQITGSSSATIPAGKTVALSSVSMTSGNDYIKCLGDATIILIGDNTVNAFKQSYGAIQAASDASTTLTITGTGSLTATSGSGAGIGGGYLTNCGNIVIAGGNITATGTEGAAGIGSRGGTTCGNITITGGTINATGGYGAAGIGSGDSGGCGNITITTGVTSVTAKKSEGFPAPNSIGAGSTNSGTSTCGTVTIGGMVYWDGSAYQNGGDTYLTTSPLTYPAPAPSYTMAAAATTSDKGKLICTAGHIHVYGEDAACTAGRVAKIIYVGTTGHATYNHGLALALTDENGGSTMNWSAAGSACSNKNTSTPVTGATWLLASQDQWNTMITAFGGYGDLRDGFSSIGGTNLQTTYRYWSSSDSGDLGYRCSFYDGSWGLSDKGNPNYARAALAF